MYRAMLVILALIVINVSAVPGSNVCSALSNDDPEYGAVIIPRIIRSMSSDIVVHNWSSDSLIYMDSLHTYVHYHSSWFDSPDNMAEDIRVLDTAAVAFINTTLFRAIPYEQNGLDWLCACINQTSKTIRIDDGDSGFVATWTVDAWDSLGKVEALWSMIDSATAYGSITLDDLFPAPESLSVSGHYCMVGEPCASLPPFGAYYVFTFKWRPVPAGAPAGSLQYYTLHYQPDYGDSIHTYETTDTSLTIVDGFIGSMWVTATYRHPNGTSEPSNVVEVYNLPIGINDRSPCRRAAVPAGLFYDMSGKQVSGRSDRNGVYLQYGSDGVLRKRMVLE